jgi:hypothetical protein
MAHNIMVDSMTAISNPVSALIPPMAGVSKRLGLAGCRNVLEVGSIGATTVLIPRAEKRA